MLGRRVAFCEGRETGEMEDRGARDNNFVGAASLMLLCT